MFQCKTEIAGDKNSSLRYFQLQVFDYSDLQRVDVITILKFSQACLHGSNDY